MKKNNTNLAIKAGLAIAVAVAVAIVALAVGFILGLATGIFK